MGLGSGTLWGFLIREGGENIIIKAVKGSNRRGSGGLAIAQLLTDLAEARGTVQVGRYEYEPPSACSP